jgi:agmatine deiminase
MAPIRAKRWSIVVILAFAMPVLASAYASSPERPLPVYETEAERSLRHLIGELHRPTSPPPGPVRCPAEFEPMDGVLISWSFSWWEDIYVWMVSEIVQSCTAYIVVENSSERQQVINELQSHGVPLDNVEFIIESLNSVWMRDYGPWFIVPPSGEMGITDFIYNRPRPLDDVFPQRLGNLWSMDVYGPDLEHAGGNFMTDGWSIAMASNLVLQENPSLTEEEVAQIIEDYIGCDRTVILQRLYGEYTGHIDMWIKFLGPHTILVGEYSEGDPNYPIIEGNVRSIRSLEACDGKPFEIIRVPMPDPYSGVYRSYTNSLFVNEKVLVPLYEISLDDSALAIYEAALPGYDIVGYDCSDIIESGGAIHCITMGATDPYLVTIYHRPLWDTEDTVEGYPIWAKITPGFGASLLPDSLLAYWTISGGPPYNTVTLTQAGPDSFEATLPVQPEGSDVSYFLLAVDDAGNRVTSPMGAPGNAHRFHVGTDIEAPEILHDPLGDQPLGAWPPTVTATVTDNMGIESVVVEMWINGEQQPDAELVRQPRTFDYEGSPAGQPNMGDSITYRIRATDTAQNPNVQYTETYGFLILTQVPVVVWEPDPTPSSGAILTAYLDSLGIEHQYRTSFPSNLSDYLAMFACLGMSPHNHALSYSQANSMVNYLEGWGSICMEGGDAWAHDTYRYIYNPYFCVDGTADGSSDLATVSGEDDTPTEGMAFPYQGENSSVDHLVPTSGGHQILHNPADGAGCGVAAAAYRTVALSFEFGGLVDSLHPSTKLQLLESFLDHMNVRRENVASVTLEPDSTSIPQGGSLGLTITVANETDESVVVRAYTEAFLKNGKPYPGNPVLGPKNVPLDPEEAVSRHVKHKIPGSTPPGTYAYTATVIRDGIILDRQSFLFQVIPGM